jgi:NitT/TauT family transport system substrate-binding protein
MGAGATMRAMGPVLILALAGSCGCTRDAAPPAAGAAVVLPKIRFKTDWYPESEHGGFYQALAKGFYREAGIDVEIVPGGPGILVPQLMLSGQVDMAMGRSDDLIVYVQQGLPFVIVGVYMQRDPQALLLHDEDPARTFSDLDNRSIMAIPGVHWMDYLQSRYHIRLRQIPLNYGIAQFMADKTFIQQCFVTNEPYYVRKNGGHPRTLMLSESGYSPYRVIFTTPAYLKDHAEAVRAFVAASLRGWDDFMNGDPSPGKTEITKLNPEMQEDFLEYGIKTMRDEHIIFGKPEAAERLGLMTRKRLQEQVDILTQLKIIPAAIPVDKFARFDLMPPALQAAAQ